MFYHYNHKEDLNQNFNSNNLLNIMRKLAFFAILLTLSVFQAHAAPAQSRTHSAVAELFTEETNSCSLSGQGLYAFNDVMADFPHILTLSCNDQYIEPSLLSPAPSPEEMEAYGGHCKKRKVEYAGMHGIYIFNIPLAMVNGRYNLNANYPAQITTGLKMADQLSEIETIDLDYTENSLKITIPEITLAAPDAHYTLSLIAFRPETDFTQSSITGVINPITAVKNLGEWSHNAITISAPLDNMEKRAFAVILQQENYGDILAAGSIEVGR